MGITYQRSPNAWSCLPTSFAMVLGIQVELLLMWLGHDGSEILWPESPDPLCRRGFHIQELIDVVFAGYAVTPFEALPVSRGATDKPLVLRVPPEYRIKVITDGQPGVATGVDDLGRPHAVAWDGSYVFDCNRRITRLEDFGLQTFWAITQKQIRP